MNDLKLAAMQRLVKTLAPPLTAAPFLGCLCSKKRRLLSASTGSPTKAQRSWEGPASGINEQNEEALYKTAPFRIPDRRFLSSKHSKRQTCFSCSQEVLTDSCYPFFLKSHSRQKYNNFTIKSSHAFV